MDSKLRELILRVPDMFIGRKWDRDGLHFLVLEVSKLAVRPESANRCSFLAVVIEQTGEFSITDNGRGLPITLARIDRSIERPKIEHVVTWIWKRHPDSHYYNQFGFLDYRGAVLNAVSEYLRIETNIDGELHSLTCSRGEIISPLKKLGPSRERGTRIAFLPDPEVFGELTFDNHRIIEGLQQLSTEYPQIEFVFEDKRSDYKVKLPKT